MSERNSVFVMPPGAPDYASDSETRMRQLAALPWPHADIGEYAIPDGWKLGDPVNSFECGAVVGVMIRHGEVLDRGRAYTKAEWETVKDDVRAFLKMRSDALGVEPWMRH